MAQATILRRKLNCTQDQLSLLLKKDRTYVAHLERRFLRLAGDARIIATTTQEVLDRKGDLAMSSIPLQRRMQQRELSLNKSIEAQLIGYREKQMRNELALAQMKAREAACRSAIEDLGWLLSHPEKFDKRIIAVFEHMLKTNLEALHMCDAMAQVTIEVRLAISKAAVQKLEEAQRIASI
jgi:hypothetical protein